MEKYLVITNSSGKDEVEYVIEKSITDDGEQFILKYHETDMTVLSVIDDGNGIVIKKIKNKMDYSMQYEVMLLFVFMSKFSHIPLKYRFVKDQSL